MRICNIVTEAMSSIFSHEVLSAPFPGVMWGPTQILNPISSAVLTFIGCKQTLLFAYYDTTTSELRSKPLVTDNDN